jgi:pseudouridine-5'-phosphate glycosidase
MLTVTDEVRDALASGKPVVALESTIISHGMPYPQNVAMARTVEGIVRDGGAVPATIAVLHGRPTIGLSADDLELLASDDSVMKVSIRDLPYVVSRGLHGATTVASTMRLAALAGISVFVTGGLGGVHRGAETSYDVSADLTELSTTSVAVVCAGVKSILDIGLTLERLETLGVPVLGFGTDEFPSFYSRSSGFGAPMRVDSPAEVAALIERARMTQARRSVGDTPDGASQVYLADTLGELGTWYALAPIVFLGGSLREIGGHNPFEPASAGAAILTGPHVTNFAETFAPLIATGGAVEVADPDDLAAAVLRWLGNPAPLATARTAARDFATKRQEALSDIVDRLCTALDLG